LVPGLSPFRWPHPTSTRVVPGCSPRKLVCLLARSLARAQTHWQSISRTPPPPLPMPRRVSQQRADTSPCWHRQHGQPAQDRSEQGPRQIPFRQQQPEVPRVLHEPTTRPDQPLLQARQRPGVDPLRQPELTNRTWSTAASWISRAARIPPPPLAAAPISTCLSPIRHLYNAEDAGQRSVI